MSKKDVKQIKIMVETNVSETPQALELSQIFNPFEKKSEQSSDTKDANDKKYPYFIESVAYDEEVLKTKSYNDILKIFFDKNTFYKTIVSNHTPIKPDVKIIEKNIMIMLNLLFPTSYPSSNNINTSYNKYLLKAPYELKMDLGEVMNVIPGFSNNSKAEYSYLKIGGKTYTITEILWLNDLLNEPEYKKIIEKLIKYNEWVDDMKDDIKTEKDTVENKIKDDINKRLNISKKDIYILKKQKQIFSKEDFEEELKNIFNHFIEQPADTLINAIVGLYSDSKPSLVSASEFNSKINGSLNTVTFKKIAAFERTNVESNIDEININANKEASSSSSSTSDTEQLLKILYASYKKYVDSNDKLKRSRSFDSIKEHDDNIQKLIDNINAINLSKANIPLDVIEKIELLFEKIKFDNSTEIKEITNKLNEIIKLSKEVKALDLVNEYILPHTQKDSSGNVILDVNGKEIIKFGIPVKYNTILTNENDKKIFTEEIKKPKYEPFINIVEAIDTFYFKQNRKSMNEQLQTRMDDYFNYKNSNFKTEILDKIVKKKYDFGNDNNVWNVSVTQYHDEKNASIKTTEIFVYMEVIDGELNAANTSSVSCSFLDEKLTDMFKKLTSSQDNNYSIPRTNKVFTVADISKKDVSDDKEPPSSTEEDANEPKTGGKYRATRKIKRNKKMRKTKRYRVRFFNPIKFY